MQPKATAKTTGKKKIQTSRTARQPKREFTFPLEKQNFMIIGGGILIIIIGYFLMSANSVDGFMPTVVAPIFLVLGYCVVIPYGILKKTSVDKIETQETVTEQTTTTQTPTISSNIKTS